MLHVPSIHTWEVHVVSSLKWIKSDLQLHCNVCCLRHRVQYLHSPQCVASKFLCSNWMPVWGYDINHANSVRIGWKSTASVKIKWNQTLISSKLGECARIQIFFSWTLRAYAIVYKKKINIILQEQLIEVLSSVWELQFCISCVRYRNSFDNSYTYIIGLPGIFFMFRFDNYFTAISEERHLWIRSDLHTRTQMIN